MKIKLLLIFFFILILTGCSQRPHLEDYNIKHSSYLADIQDRYMDAHLNGIHIPVIDAVELENNKWYKMAKELAPSSIVIRQLILIDIILQEPRHYEEILKLIKLLSYWPYNGCIWSEGYSYFEFVYKFLDQYIVYFNPMIDTEELEDMISYIKNGFVETAYKRDSLWYPAPFGDLRDIPLSDELQTACSRVKEEKKVECSIITKKIEKDTIIYKIMGKPIGLNSHIPIDTFYVNVVNGLPNIKFYTGYNNKYKSKIDEVRDVYDPRRLKSLKEMK
jgi:hypothetical protein